MGVDELKDDVFKLTETPADFERRVVLQRWQLFYERLHFFVHLTALVSVQIHGYQLARDFLNSFLDRSATLLDHLGVLREEASLVVFVHRDEL